MQTNTDTVIDTVTAAELAGIEDALGDLDMNLDAVADDTAVTDVVEEPTIEEIVEAAADPEITEDVDAALTLDEDAIGALEIEAAKEEAYETQPSDESDVADTTAEPAPAAAQPAAAKPKKASTPRQPRDLASLNAEAFVLTTDIPADLDANKAAVIAAAPSQKKVAEKFENLLMSAAANRAPSVYTLDCFRHLLKKGEITSVELVAALKATPKKDGTTYSEGTARSQAGQIMALFPVLKIASRDKQTLKLNPDSTIAEFMKGLIEAGA